MGELQLKEKYRWDTTIIGDTIDQTYDDFRKWMGLIE